MSQRKNENKMDSQSSRQYSSGTDASPAPVTYHGLENQGATCYLNSVLQVLFMTRDFREAVEKSMSGDTECIDLQLKDLFNDLKERQGLTYKITKKLGIDRVNEQQDAAEYFEKILSLTSEEASQIFHGELTNKIKCSTCDTEKSSDGKFWHLPLELVKSNSETYHVVDGIEEYFRELYFSGDNQMYCDQCDDKSDATTKCELQHPPEVLTLLLKRFEFDYNYMRYIKNNCTVDVPFTLHIPESHMYELYAVVDHCGDLRSGHYTATVKPQGDDRWYNFNDSRVRLYDHEPYHSDKPNGSCSAYLLFYRNKQSSTADTSTPDIRDVSVSGDLLPAVGNNDDQCQDVGKKRKREDDEEAVKVGKERREDRSDVDDQEQERDERKIMNDDGEVGDTGAENRGAFTETQPGESREDQDGEDNGRLNKPQEGLEAKHNASYNEQRHKQEVSSMQAEQGYPPQVNVNMQRDEERKATYVNTDKTGEREGDEQTDKERKTLTKHPNRDKKDEFNKGLDIVKQEVREECGPPCVSVNKQRDEEEMEINERDDKRGKTDRPASGGGEPMAGSDHDCREIENHRQHSASRDDEGCKQRSSSGRSYQRHEPQEEEGKDDKGQMERKARNDQTPQERSKSESGRRKSDLKNRADVRSDRSEQKVRVRQNKTLSLEKQVKEEKRTGDRHHGQIRPDTSLKHVRSGESKRLTENQRVSVERTRVEDCQSKAKDKDDTVGGVNERERSSEMKTVEKMSKHGTKRQANTGGGNKRKSGPRADGAVALPEGFDDISLSPSPQEQRSRKTGHVEGKKKKKKTIGCFSWTKNKRTEKGSDDVPQTKKKNIFFSLFRRKRKNLVKASELEQKKKKKNADRDSKSE